MKIFLEFESRGYINQRSYHVPWKADSLHNATFPEMWMGKTFNFTLASAQVYWNQLFTYKLKLLSSENTKVLNNEFCSFFIFRTILCKFSCAILNVAWMVSVRYKLCDTYNIELLNLYCIYFREILNSELLRRITACIISSRDFPFLLDTVRFLSWFFDYNRPWWTLKMTHRYI